jgi:hypothetical protein
MTIPGYGSEIITLNYTRGLAAAGAGIGLPLSSIVGAVLTPEQFGAKGDDIADDTVALASLVATINSPATAGQTTVLLGCNRVYRTTQPLAFTVGNGRIIGQGGSAFHNMGTGNTIQIANTLGCDGWYLENFAMLGSVGGGPNQNGLSLGNLGADAPSDITCIALDAKNLTGIGFDIGNPPASAPLTGTRFVSCRAYNCTSRGWLIASQSNHVSCQAANCPGVGVYFGSGNITWSDGDVTQCGTGFFIAGGGNDGHNVIANGSCNHNMINLQSQATHNPMIYLGIDFYQGDIVLTGYPTGSTSQGQSLMAVHKFVGCTIDVANYNNTGAAVYMLDCTYDSAYFVAAPAETGGGFTEIINPLSAATLNQQPGATFFASGTHADALPAWVGQRLRNSHAMSDADFTLNPQESHLEVLEITGAPIATRNCFSLLIPTAGHRPRVVVNRTGQTIVFWMAGGQGLNIPAGNAMTYTSDGTNLRCISLVAATETATAQLDPTTLTATGFVRGSYGGAPWAGTASAGTSGAKSFTAGTASPTVGTAINGLTPAVFNGTSQFLVDSVATIGGYVAAAAYEVELVINPGVQPTAAAAIYNNPGILADSNGNFGIVMFNDGTNDQIAVYQHTAGGYFSAQQICGRGNWHHVRCSYDGTNMVVTVDGIPGQPQAAGNITGGLAGIAEVGRSNAVTVAYWAGSILEIFTTQAAPAKQALAYTGYVNSRYQLLC